MTMNKLSIALLGLFSIALLVVGSYMAEAKWKNNGDGTYTIIYKYTDAEKQQIEESFAAMYPQAYEAWKAEGKTDQGFVNEQVKHYITEVRQSYELQKAEQKVVVPTITDNNE